MTASFVSFLFLCWLVVLFFHSESKDEEGIILKPSDLTCFTSSSTNLKTRSREIRLGARDLSM